MKHDAAFRACRCVLVTVDPERDTPAVLAGYLRQFDPTFLGLTGDPAEIRRLAAALGIGITRIELPGGAYDFDHTRRSCCSIPAPGKSECSPPLSTYGSSRRSLSRVAPELRAAA